MQRQPLFACEGGQRILRAAFLVRRAAHRNDVLATGQKLLEHRLSEGFLPVNDNTHASLLKPRSLCICWVFLLFGLACRIAGTP